VLVGIAALAASSVGLEFLPKLEEGNIWMRAALPPSVSLDEGNGYVNRMRGLIKGFPEVETVVSQHGRPDDGTDPDGFSNGEFFVALKPMQQWRRASTRKAWSARWRRAAPRLPGVNFAFSQYIQDNVQEAPPASTPRTPSRSAAPTSSRCSKVAAEIRRALEKVRGITDIQVPPLLGQPTIRIDIDRQRAARYGLSPGDINATIQAAVGGQAAAISTRPAATATFPCWCGCARIPREHGSAEPHRHRRPGPTAASSRCRLSEVATIGLSSGAFYIYREQQERYIPVKFSRARPRPRQRRARGAAEGRAEVQLPSGYRLDWAGDFANFQNAIDRLSIAVPIAIALILLLLYVSFGSLRDTLLAGSAIPMALIGGILGLWLADMSFSISAAIGFVALFGIAAMNGIMVVGCFNRLVDAGLEREAALRRDLRAADAAGADDLRRRLRRPAAGRLLDRDRQPGPAPARHRRGRRHAAGADPVPHRAARRRSASSPAAASRLHSEA
jgi:cobalt-zinc-cadmium resistance protein CzcA